MVALRVRVDLGAMVMMGVLRLPQSSSFTGTSQSDFLVSYQGYSLRESYPSVEMQSMYSTPPGDWAIFVLGLVK